MTYTLYIDRLFFLNFMMNLYLLFLMKWSMGRTATRFRIWSGAVLGAFTYCILLVSGVLPDMIKVIGYVLLSLAMVQYTFRFEKLTGLLNSMVHLYGFSFLLGGGIYVLERKGKKLFGEEMLILTGGFLVTALYFYIQQKKQKKEERNRFAVEIRENGIIWKGTGFFDTGNSLCDPVNGKPVCILTKQLREQIGKDIKPEHFKIIPYRTVDEQGILYGMKVREFIVTGEEGSYSFSDVIVAFSNRDFSEKGDYQVILHPELKRKIGKARLSL